jgi:hypothetical protein
MTGVACEVAVQTVGAGVSRLQTSKIKSKYLGLHFSLEAAP